MEEPNKGRLCPACGGEIAAESASAVCSGCGSVYHEACWKEGECPVCKISVNQAAGSAEPAEEISQQRESSIAMQTPQPGPVRYDPPAQSAPQAPVLQSQPTQPGQYVQPVQPAADLSGQYMQPGQYYVQGDGSVAVMQKKKSRTPLILALAAVILVAVLAVAVLAVNLFGGSRQEQLAMEAAQEVQDRLLVPDSLHLMRIYVKEYDRPDDQAENDVWTTARVFIYYSATNKGGGITDKDCCIYFKSDGSVEAYFEHTDLEISLADSDERLLYEIENMLIPDASEYITWDQVDADKIEQKILN